MDECLARTSSISICSVIYCVVPEPLAPELYARLAKYYEDDPNVTVIVDRRKQERREAGGGGGLREVRDRRRPRVTGDFAPLAADAWAGWREGRPPGGRGRTRQPGPRRGGRRDLLTGG